MKRALSIAAAALLAGCSAPNADPQADAGGARPDAGPTVSLAGAQAAALTVDFEVATISAAGEVVVSDVRWMGFEAVRGRALVRETIAAGGGYARVEAATGKEEPLAVSDVATFVGENAAGDLVFSDASTFRLKTRAIEKIVTGNVKGVRAMAGNHASVELLNGAYEVVDTVTGKHFAADATGRLAALGAHKALLSGGTVIDMATGASHALASGSFFWEASAVDATGATFVGSGCPGGGLCRIDEAEALTSLFSSALSLSSELRSFVADGRYSVVLERGVSQATLVTKGTDAKVAILSGIDVEDFDVLDPLMVYAGLDQQGKAVLGRLDLSTLADLRLSAPKAIKKVRFLKP